MQGGAVTLARMARELGEIPDLILASDMLNLPTFLTLCPPEVTRVPVALYFHENQLTYPLQPGQKRDLHFGFLNFVSGLRAQAVLFNSRYHLEAFFDELPRLLKHFPDYNELWTVDALRGKSQVLPLGLELARLDAYRPGEPPSGRPTILWNHRWEYDKDPETFFRAVDRLAEEGLDFELILLGESFRNKPSEFLSARRRLPERIAHFGYASSEARYGELLWRGDIVVSTALHEFFGASVVEAVYCDCLPILPRRLAYPELLPAAWHDRCLYDDFEGLVSLLRDAILQIGATRATSLRAAVEGYGWPSMAPVYDRLLSGLVTQPARA
jgi:glycosyltransferase involved in cell wall biosynthesis